MKQGFKINDIVRFKIDLRGIFVSYRIVEMTEDKARLVLHKSPLADDYDHNKWHL